MWRFEIHPDLFINLNNIVHIKIKNIHFRRVMHNSGIGWIKNYNKEVNCNPENLFELRYYIMANKLKSIVIDCYGLYSLSLIDIFPDEDFCLYKDLPINQLVVLIESCYGEKHIISIINFLLLYFFGVYNYIFFNVIFI